MNSLTKALITAACLLSFGNFLWAQQTATQSALRSSIVNQTRDATVASGSVGYTGIGFRPRQCLFFSSIGGTQNFSIGGAASNLSMGMVGMYPTPTGITNATQVVAIYTDAGAANGQTATVTSFDADGFTLSWTKIGAPTGTINIQAFCML